MPDSVLLWTRVTPSAEAVPGSGKGLAVDVRWEVAKDAGFADVVARGHLRTAPSRDVGVVRPRFGVVSCAIRAVGHFAPYGCLSGRDDQPCG